MAIGSIARWGLTTAVWVEHEKIVCECCSTLSCRRLGCLSTFGRLSVCRRRSLVDRLPARGETELGGGQFTILKALTVVICATDRSCVLHLLKTYLHLIETSHDFIDSLSTSPYQLTFNHARYYSIARNTSEFDRNSFSHKEILPTIYVTPR